MWLFQTEVGRRVDLGHAMCLSQVHVGIGDDVGYATWLFWAVIGRGIDVDHVQLLSQVHRGVLCHLVFAGIHGRSWL